MTLPLQPRRLDRLDHVSADHDLKTAALCANVKVQLIRRGPLPVAAVQRARAQGQAAARARAQADYWPPFLPDAYFIVIYPNNVVRHVVVN